MNDYPRVLLIDDDVELAEMYRLGLASDGWDVAVAHDGSDGMRQSFNLPDLIVLDIQIPPSGGLAVLDVIRAHPTTAHLPVVMFSNRDDVEAIEAAFERGATDYLIKAHTTPALLSRSLRSVLADEARLRSAAFSGLWQALETAPGHYRGVPH